MRPEMRPLFYHQFHFGENLDRSTPKPTLKLIIAIELSSIAWIKVLLPSRAFFSLTHANL
jgi:hypothetical protein